MSRVVCHPLFAIPESKVSSPRSFPVTFSGEWRADKMLTEEQVREIIGEVAPNVDAVKIPSHADLMDSGLDSLDQASILLTIKERYDYRFSGRRRCAQQAPNQKQGVAKPIKVGETILNSFLTACRFQRAAPRRPKRFTDSVLTVPMLEAEHQKAFAMVTRPQSDQPTLAQVGNRPEQARSTWITDPVMGARLSCGGSCRGVHESLSMLP